MKAYVKVKATVKKKIHKTVRIKLKIQLHAKTG